MCMRQSIINYFTHKLHFDGAVKEPSGRIDIMVNPMNSFLISDIVQL